MYVLVCDLTFFLLLLAFRVLLKVYRLLYLTNKKWKTMYLAIKHHGHLRARQICTCRQQELG